MLQHFKTAMTSKYADFRTRSTRSEYWYFTLAYVILSIIIFIPLMGMGASAAFGSGSSGGGLGIMGTVFTVLWVVLILAMFIPSLSVMVRRLHDIGKSGWWYFIGFIPLVGPIILIVFLCTESQRGANKWGPNPHGLADGNDVAGHLVKEDLI